MWRGWYWQAAPTSRRSSARATCLTSACRPPCWLWWMCHMVRPCLGCHPKALPAASCWVHAARCQIWQNAAWTRLRVHVCSEAVCRRVHLGKQRAHRRAGGENGFNQAIELSADTLANVKFVQEKRLISKFFDEISQDTGARAHLSCVSSCAEGGVLSSLSVLHLHGWEGNASSPLLVLLQALTLESACGCRQNRVWRLRHAAVPGDGGRGDADRVGEPGGMPCSPMGVLRAQHHLHFCFVWPMSSDALRTVSHWRPSILPAHQYACCCASPGMCARS